MKRVIAPKFVDHHAAYDAPAAYTTTNEEAEILASLLGKRRFKRAACISSAGEVLLTVVAPHADEVVAVDHSRGAIAVATTKALLLQHLGIRKFKQMLTDMKYSELQKLADELFKHASEPLQKEYQKQRYYCTPRGDWRREWHYTPNGAGRIAKRIGNITFVHSDVRDLAKLYEPFDLLYLSNALEHSTRDHKPLPLTGVAPLLAVGGTLLFTSASPNKLYPGFKLVESMFGWRTTWYHNVAVKLEDAAPILNSANQPAAI